MTLLSLKVVRIIYRVLMGLLSEGEYSLALISPDIGGDPWSLQNVFPTHKEKLPWLDVSLKIRHFHGCLPVQSGVTSFISMVWHTVLRSSLSKG